MLERKQAEDRSATETNLQMAYCRALELASFKGGFLMRTAHELRSPLNKIISLQQMILEGLCDDVEEEREFVADAYAASLKLLEYLDLMTRVSKVEMGRLKPQLQPVAIANVLAQVQELTHLQVADRNLRLHVEPPDPAWQVQADGNWLCNVLATLIEIAVEGSDRGTLKLYATHSPAATGQIWLEDDRPTTLWQEPWPLPAPQEFTLDDTLPPSLRMSLVNAMTQAMGGQFTRVAAAEATSGTHLCITLPVPPPDAPTAQI